MSADYTAKQLAREITVMIRWCERRFAANEYSIGVEGCVKYIQRTVDEKALQELLTFLTNDFENREGWRRSEVRARLAVERLSGALQMIARRRAEILALLAAA